MLLIVVRSQFSRKCCIFKRVFNLDKSIEYRCNTYALLPHLLSKSFPVKNETIICNNEWLKGDQNIFG